jgi:hypothetical protein
MPYYKIGGISVSVMWENEAGKKRRYTYSDCAIQPRTLQAFHDDSVSEIDLEVRVRTLGGYTGPEKFKIIGIQSYYEKDGYLNLTVYDPFKRNIPGFTLSMTKDYSLVEYTPHIPEYETYDLQWMIFPFEGRVLYSGGLVLHGAAVEYGGKGFVFIGASGAGKTTQAALWRNNRNALVINGDAPLIRLIDGAPYAFGTPWCGTSGEAVNRAVPLDSIIIVKKGAESSLRELKGSEAFLTVFANVLRSNFDERSLDLAAENTDPIINCVRVFELTGSATVKDVELLEKAIF